MFGNLLAPRIRQWGSRRRLLVASLESNASISLSHSPLQRLTGGADLSQIGSIGPHAALQLIAEIGTDMRRWPSEKHITSWLTLSPSDKISGGRLISSKTRPSANRAAVILRRCAMSLTRTATALGAFYRRLAARVGKPVAITATDRKLAAIVYRVLWGDLVYNDPGATAYHQLHSARELKPLRKRARVLGFHLVDQNNRRGHLLTCFLRAEQAGHTKAHPTADLPCARFRQPLCFRCSRFGNFSAWPAGLRRWGVMAFSKETTADSAWRSA